MTRVWSADLPQLFGTELFSCIPSPQLWRFQGCCWQLQKPLAWWELDIPQNSEEKERKQRLSESRGIDLRILNRNKQSKQIRLLDQSWTNRFMRSDDSRFSFTSCTPLWPTKSNGYKLVPSNGGPRSEPLKTKKLTWYFPATWVCLKIVYP